MSKQLNVSWAAEPGATGYQVEIALAGQPYQRVYDGTATSTSVRVTADGAYSVRVRAYTGASYGPWATTAQTVTGATEALSAMLSPTSLATTEDDTSQSSAPVTVTPAGGVRPYSYSWELQSGSSRIVVNSPTSSSTTFSVSGLAFDETVSAIYRCRVTDSAGASLLTSNAVTVSFTQATAAVQNVTGFALTDNGDGTARLSWNAITDPQVRSLEIRYSALTTGATWAGASLLNVVDAAATELQVTLLRGTYLIKARSALDESPIAATAVFAGTVGGAAGPSFVPTLIPAGARFVVPADCQAPYRFGCRVEGLLRLEGLLVMTP